MLVQQRLVRTVQPLGRLADETAVQFLCEDLDLAGQVGVAFELQFLGYEVVVGFGLLELGLAVLADHDERRQEDRFKLHHESQYRPRVLFQ